MKQFGHARRRVFYGVLVLTVLIIGIKCFSRVPDLPPVIMLDGIRELPAVELSLLDRVPMSWGWFWRLREKVFGVRRTVSLDGYFVNCKGLSDVDLGDFNTQRPGFTNVSGTRVWIAGGKELERLRKQFRAGGRILSSPRTLTAHEVGSSQATWQTVALNGKQEQVGFFNDYIPRVRGETIDLMALFRNSCVVTNQTAEPSQTLASIQTNVLLAARFQIPDGKGVFVLLENQPNEAENYGFIISAGLPKK